MLGLRHAPPPPGLYFLKLPAWIQVWISPSLQAWQLLISMPFLGQACHTGWILSKMLETKSILDFCLSWILQYLYMHCLRMGSKSKHELVYISHIPQGVYMYIHIYSLDCAGTRPRAYCHVKHTLSCVFCIPIHHFFFILTVACYMRLSVNFPGHVGI